MFEVMISLLQTAWTGTKVAYHIIKWLAPPVAVVWFTILLLGWLGWGWSFFGK